MLDTSIGIDILNGLFAFAEKKPEEIAFDGEIYLGLFTVLPNNNGQNFSEPPDGVYRRIRIDTTSVASIDPTGVVNEKNFIGGAQLETDAEGLPISYVANQSQIMFYESSVYWGTIVGFGLFRTSKTDSGETPFLWGEISPVTVDKHEVPIIRSGFFKISLI